MSAKNLINWLGDYHLLKDNDNCRLRGESRTTTIESPSSSSSEERMNKEMADNNNNNNGVKKMKKMLLVLNCFMLAIGISGGPLVMRLYYLHGGKSIWLSAWLETGGWPIMIVPLLLTYFRRRVADRNACLFLIKPPMVLYAALIGLIAGFGDFVYAYGVKHIPVSTSSLILATQLAFTATFAYVFVKQKLTVFSINAVALLTFGAVVLALHASKDRPAGESKTEYYMGFFFTFLASAAFAIMLPLIELVYKRSKQAVVYPLVMEIQLILSLSATTMCTVGMLISGDHKTIAREAKDYKLGEVMFFVVLAWSAIVWQFFYLGAVGVIYYGSSLLSGIIIAVALPITEVMAVIFYHEQFQVDKGVSLALSLWGFLSYFYGEAKETKKQKKNEMMQQSPTNNV